MCKDKRGFDLLCYPVKILITPSIITRHPKKQQQPTWAPHFLSRHRLFYPKTHAGVIIRKMQGVPSFPSSSLAEYQPTPAPSALILTESNRSRESDAWLMIECTGAVRSVESNMGSVDLTTRSRHTARMIREMSLIRWRFGDEIQQREILTWWMGSGLCKIESSSSLIYAVDTLKLQLSDLTRCRASRVERATSRTRTCAPCSHRKQHQLPPRWVMDLTRCICESSVAPVTTSSWAQPSPVISTHSEHSGMLGGEHSASSSGTRAKKTNAGFQRLPYNWSVVICWSSGCTLDWWDTLNSCALTLKPVETPVCTPEGIVFELLAIIPWLKEHGTNPVTGKALGPGELIKIQFHFNSDGESCCFYGVLNDANVSFRGRKWTRSDHIQDI